MSKPSVTFANFPSCDNLETLEARLAILGIPYGTPYDPDAELHSRDAPAAIRSESVRYADDPIAWDFDLNGPLIGRGSGKVVDCGDVPGELHDPEGNSRAVRDAVRGILKAGAIPVVLGGDDSIPIPVLHAYDGQEPFTLLQVDAHIDWRDEVGGIRDGYSSTMRRASEMPQVHRILQVGMRGVGSARTEEVQAALDYGATLITSYRLKEEGASGAVGHLPEGGRCFLTVDLDALDPSEMPAVTGPTPGGLSYVELVQLIHAVSERTEIVGACVVELVPALDLNRFGAITAMRVVWNLIGALLR